MKFIGIDGPEPIVLELPWPPSVNCYWLHTRHGRTFIGSRGRTFRQNVKAIVADRRVGTIPGMAKIEIDLYPPTRRQFDVDNFNKGIFDALEHSGVVQNDRQFVELNVCKREVVKGGKAVVRITDLGATP